MLLPVRVLGPLSECSRAATVVGQITGSTVRITTTEGRVLAEGMARWSEQTFDLTGPLRAGESVIAFQSLDGETSPIPPEKTPVQPAPDLSAISLQYVGVLHGCAGCVLVTGAVPGAQVTLRVAATGEVLGDAPAVNGDAYIVLRRAVRTGEELEALQTACGRTGPAVRSAPADAVALDARQRLPPPWIVEPLGECDRALAVGGVVEGALVDFRRSVGIPLSAWLGTTGSWIAPIDPPLGFLETLTARQAMPSCDLESDDSRPVTAGPLRPLQAPVIEPPLCADSTRVVVRNLRPGSVVTLYLDDVELGRGEAPRPTFELLVPGGRLRARGHLAAEQAICNGVVRSPRSYTVAIAPPLDRLDTLRIREPLFACATVVRVEGVVPGSLVSIREERTDVWRSDLVLVRDRQAEIAVRPALRAGEKVYAAGALCGRRARSAAVMAQEVRQLAAPSVEEPIHEGATSVVVTAATPAAVVEVAIDGVWRAAAVASAGVAVFGTGAPLRVGQRVEARQRLCSLISSVASAVTVRRRPLRVVTPVRLPAATPEVAYGIRLQAADGLPPYSWAISSAFPGGLTLEPDGLLHGTVTGPTFGTIDFPLRVTVFDRDTPPASIVGSFVLPVQAAAASPPPPPPPPAGSARLVVYNCETEGHAVHVWLREAVAGAPWEERGSLRDMRDDSRRCPVGAPFIADLEDGRLYEWAAVVPAGPSCGVNDPTILGCRRNGGTVVGMAAGRDFVVTVV
jgi:hypothetical protein